MASSITVEKVDRPELAKHDSSILGEFLFCFSERTYLRVNIFI